MNDPINDSKSCDSSNEIDVKDLFIITSIA